MEDLIVLTGGTGWVGRNFLHELQKIFSASTFNTGTSIQLLEKSNHFYCVPKK